jgi:hypothetical protein
MQNNVESCFVHSLKKAHYDLNGSRDSAVGIKTGYRRDDQGVGVQVPVWARIFTSPCHPGRLWDPSNLISNGYRRGGGAFPGGKAAAG